MKKSFLVNDWVCSTKNTLILIKTSDMLPERHYAVKTPAKESICKEKKKISFALKLNPSWIIKTNNKNSLRTYL